ncbi:hypothetical protein [Clostridium sp. UBA5988]|uniref:hypothetical protein n=1 Tax=Clostridium sp. UBA5988 TaxID=1946369 RepID=UPI0032177F3B
MRGYGQLSKVISFRKGINSLEYFGLIAFVLVLSQMGYSSKIKKLEGELKNLKRKIKGEEALSKLLKDLIGVKCIIDCDGAVVFTGKSEMECEVLDVDDEWVKITYKDKKDVTKTNIIRIESIDNIEIIN